MLASGHGPTGSLQVLRPRRHKWRGANSVLEAAIAISAMSGRPPDAPSRQRELRGCRCSRQGAASQSGMSVSISIPNIDNLGTGAGSSETPNSSQTNTAPSAAQAQASTPASAPSPAPVDSEAARRGLASMAQLASAWAQVSCRLAPGTQLATSDAVAAAAATVHQAPGGSAAAGAAVTQQHQQVLYPAGPSSAVSQQPSPFSASTWEDADAAGRSIMQPPSGYQPNPWQQPQQQRKQEQQAPPPPRPHFEAIITALKLALASLQSAPLRRDGRSPATRAVQLASTLADLCAAGLPLDASAMCAGVVAEAVDVGALRHDVIRAQLGPSVAALVHDMLLVRQAPRRIELLDDEGASAVREWCLAFHDVRACVVEVVSWWDELQHMGSMPMFEQQALALEALQIGAPLGHALGLGPLSSLMEDMCLKVLFPDSYASTSAWLRGLMDPAEDALFAAQQRLLAALDAHAGFGRLAGGLVVKARTKSLFSVMKKLLHLGDLSRGGRSREELYDLLGMRAIVKAPDFLPPDEAEAAATKACYIVQDVASTLWRPIPARSKDYIVAPKSNGYQSIHLTLHLGQLDMSYETYGTPSSSSFDGAPLEVAHRGSGSSGSGSAAADAAGASGPSWDAESAADGALGGPLCLELQIRTVAMDRAAESGDAAHAVYKGGLDARTAKQLQAWTQELRTRLAAQPRGRLLLRAASTGKMSAEEAQEAVDRRTRRRERRAAAAAAAAAATLEAMESVVAQEARSASSTHELGEDGLGEGLEAGTGGAVSATAATVGEGPIPRPPPSGAASQSAADAPVPAVTYSASASGVAGTDTSRGAAPYRLAPKALKTAPSDRAPLLSPPRRAGAARQPSPAPPGTPRGPSTTQQAAPAPRRQNNTAGASASVHGQENGLQPHLPTQQQPSPSAAAAGSHVVPMKPAATAPSSTGTPQPPAEGRPLILTQQQSSQQPSQQPSQQLQAILFASVSSIDEVEEPMMIGLGHRDAVAAAEQLFRHLDVNGDGRLSLGEVRQVLLDLAAPASDRDAAALMAALDRNGDGGVSMEEFVKSVSLAQLQQEQEQREAQRRETQRAAQEAAIQRQQQWQPWHRM